MAMVMPHGVGRIRCSQDLQAHRHAAPLGTSRGCVPVPRALKMWVHALHRPREAAARLGRGRGTGDGPWPEPPCLAAPSPTPAPGGPPALAGKWQQGTKAACGGRRVSALPAGRPPGPDKGPVCAAAGALPGLAGSGRRPARAGSPQGGRRARPSTGATAGPSLPPSSASAAGLGVPRDARGHGALASACSAGAGQDGTQPELGGVPRGGTSLLQPPAPIPAMSPSPMSPYPPSAMSPWPPPAMSPSPPRRGPQRWPRADMGVVMVGVSPPMAGAP